ncbi:MAG: hypothetical protein ACRDHN_14040 [Thermomicrobiales bacterium]
MRGWRIALKGLSDTLEYLLPFVVASLSWWVSLVTVILAPATTQSLFRVADPRVTSNLERANIWENARHPIAKAKNAWRLLLLTLAPIIILLGNLAFYTSSDRGWRLLIPLWVILLCMFVMVALVAWSIVSLFDQSPGHALRLAAGLTLGRPKQLFATLIVAAPIILIASLLIVPLFLFVPATVAAMTNRFTLAGLGIAIDDPLEPSEERLAEQQKEATSKKFGP